MFSIGVKKNAIKQRKSLEGRNKLKDLGKEK